MKHIVLFFFLFTALSLVKAQGYTYSALVHTDPLDSCGRQVDMVTTGFNLPLTHYITDGSSVTYYSTTANPVNYCQGQYIYSYDAACHHMLSSVDDADTIYPPFYVKSVVYNYGGVSPCDNSITISVSGLQGTSMNLMFDDMDVMDPVTLYSGSVSDSTFTMSGFCLGDWAGTNEHSLSFGIWDNLTLKYCSWHLFAPPVGYIGGGVCNSTILTQVIPVPASDMVTCNGSVSLSVTGDNPPFTYLYSNGGTTPTQTGLCPGVYDVTVTDAGGASRSTSFLIADSANIYYDNPSMTPVDTLLAGIYMDCSIDFSSPFDTIYIDSIINLTPQVVRVTYVIVQDTSTYRWSESYYTDTSGYFCFITNVACEETTARVSSNYFTAYLFGTSSGTLGVSSVKDQSRELTISPNPGNTICFVKGLQPKNSIRLVDLNGRTIKSIENSNGYLSLHDVRDGLYVVHVIQENGSYASKLVVKHN